MQKNFLICFLTFVRPRDVQKIYGVSRQSLWRYVRSGWLEAPTEISPSIRGWSRATLDAFFGIIPDTVNNHTLLDDRLVCEEIVPPSVKKLDKKGGAQMRYSVSEIEAQFLSAINDAGIPYDGDINGDSKSHRFHIKGDRPGSKNGFYILHVNGYCPAGYFEDFRQGIKRTWKFANCQSFCLPSQKTNKRFGKFRCFQVFSAPSASLTFSMSLRCTGQHSINIFYCCLSILIF